MNITVDLEFERLLLPLADDEKASLEASIREHGCLTPLVMWRGHDVILDGHHRWAICKKLGVDLPTVEIDLPDRSAAMDWILCNQLARRNLTPTQAKILLGRRLRAEKKPVGRPKQCAQFEHIAEPKRTAERIAEQAGVSAATVRRAEKIVDQVDALPAEDRKAVETGRASLRGVQPKPAADEPPKDALGTPLTEAKVVAAFALVGDMDKAMRALSTAKGIVGKASQTTVATYLDDQATANLIEQARANLKFAVPYAVATPAARASNDKANAAGWVPKDVHDRLPKELK